MSLLEVRGLTRFFGGVAAVDDLSFAVHEGEVVGLIGPNGAGKSTTFNLITGFLRPSRGRVLFAGEDVTGQKPSRLSRRGLVRTFQESVLFHEMTVADNVYVAAKAAGVSRRTIAGHVEDVLSFTGLAPVADESAGNLSHGRQRMLGIAIALAARPKLLCLDEPLTGMNAVEADHTLQVLRRVRDERHTTLLLVEHNMRAVMNLCDRIVVLNYGRKLSEGTPEEVRRNPDVIAAYLGTAE